MNRHLRFRSCSWLQKLKRHFKLLVCYFEKERIGREKPWVLQRKGVTNQYMKANRLKYDKVIRLVWRRYVKTTRLVCQPVVICRLPGSSPCRVIKASHPPCPCCVHRRSDAADWPCLPFTPWWRSGFVWIWLTGLESGQFNTYNDSMFTTSLSKCEYRIQKLKNNVSAA